MWFKLVNVVICLKCEIDCFGLVVVVVFGKVKGFVGLV